MRRDRFLNAGTVIAVYFIIAVSLPLENGWCWWFQQSDETLLQNALNSDNPRKVEKCLDTFIKKENYSAILQIKQHAKRMLQVERGTLAQQQQINSAVIKKRLAPWKQIEQKADRFFKRTTVQPQGK
jgi:hypothetical protein